MPLLSKHFNDVTKLKQTRQYIETGCYLGNGLKEVAPHYTIVHSIELSDKWYNYNVDQFKFHTNVKMHHGDSKKVLPELLDSIREPVTIYLDAHFSGGNTAFGDEETPLLQELDLLAMRPYDDIIIIDDCRLLGNKGQCGSGPNDPIYPTMQYDWTDVTAEEIVNRMKEGYQVFSNENRQWTTGEADQILLVPIKSL